MSRILWIAVDGWHFRNHQLPLARRVVAAGHQVEVAAGPGLRSAGEPAGGLPFHALPLRKTLRPDHAWRAVRAIARLARELRPNLVQLHSVRAVVLGGLALRSAGIPVLKLVSGRGYAFTGAPAPLRAAVAGLWRHGPRGAGTWTAFQNQEDLEACVGAGLAERGRASLVAGSGVDLEVLRPRPEAPGPPIVLFASRMLRSKGVGELIEASAALRRQGVVHRLLLAGAPDPGNPASLRASQLRAWHAGGAAEWLGEREDIPELLARCAVVALPTRYGEGLPRILLEAAAVGRPAVATRAPGCIDAIEDGVTGLLVPPGDAPALARALAELLQDPERRAAMGRRARIRAEERFGLERVAASYLDLYRRLLAEHEADARTVSA